MTKINFLVTVSICCQEIRLWELIIWSPKRKDFDLSTHSLRKCIEITLENLFVDIGASRVNFQVCSNQRGRHQKRRGKGEEIGERVKRTPPPPLFLFPSVLFFPSPSLASHFCALAMQSSLLYMWLKLLQVEP